VGLITQLIEKRYSLADADKKMDFLTMGRPSYTGVAVNERTALNNVAVFACVRLLSETLASIPLPLYRRLTKRSKRRAFEHPLYSLLHNSPNPEMTSFNFREALMAHLVLWGNAYAEIDWDMPTGRPRALWPFRPDKMSIKRDNGKLFYHYRLPDGAEVTLPSYRMLHIPGLGFDGVVGYSPIHMAREAIGLSLATEEFGARFFGNGAKPGGVLEHPGKLGESAQENLRKSWNEMHKGLSNQHRIAILEEGMKYQQVGIPPDDAQFLETRKFQRAEIASFFHIPPHMIGDLEHATFSNIEHQGIEFVVYTMRPWFVRWEQMISKKLLGPNERTEYFAEFLVEGLLRGDVESRYKAYATGRQWGWLSANDIRELENMDPLPGDQGNIYYVPMNMLPAGGVASGEGEAKGLVRGSPSPESSAVKGEEERGLRAAMNRHRTAESYRRVFEDAAGRIVKREKDNVLRAARKHLAERGMVEFNEWLDDFYRDFPEFIGRQMAPAIYALAEAIQAIAADEVNGEAGMTAELENFLRQYGTAFNARYVKSSKGQLQALINEAVDAGESPLEAIITRLDEWEEKRPGKTGMNEVTQLSNAVAKTIFAGAGITRLRWMALGSKSCPLCQEMDGKVVGIEQSFLAEGDTLLAEGGSEIKAYRPTTHPPLHLGCLPGSMLVAAEGIAASSEYWFDGDIIVLYTSRGHKLTCTPNHPILTGHGWIAAGSLHVGDDVISGLACNGNESIGRYYENMPARIEDIAKSFCKPNEMSTIPVPMSAKDFHGDGRDGKVAIIRANSELLAKHSSSFNEPASNNPLGMRDVDLPSLLSFGGQAKGFKSRFKSDGGRVSSRNLISTLIRSHIAPNDSTSFTTGSRRHPVGHQVITYNGPRDPEVFRNGKYSLPIEIVSDKIVRVEYDSFHGNVYNLHTDSQWYIAGGFVVHNCVCQIVAE